MFEGQEKVTKVLIYNGAQHYCQRYVGKLSIQNERQSSTGHEVLLSTAKFQILGRF